MLQKSNIFYIIRTESVTLSVRDMAISLFQNYNNLYRELQSLKTREAELQVRLERENAAIESKKAAYKAELDAELKDIDEAVLDLDVYIDGALNHGAVGNYSPSPMLCDPLELQNLYTMLSDSLSSSSYAVELYRKASDAKEYYLRERRKKENLFNQKLRDADASRDFGSASGAVDSERNRIAAGFNELAQGRKAQSLLEDIKKRVRLFNIKADKIYDVKKCVTEPEIFCFGYIYVPYPLPDGYLPAFKRTFGPFVSRDSGSILLPVGFFSDGAQRKGKTASPVISIKYDASTSASVGRIHSGLLFNILRNYKPMRHRVTFIDYDTFNPEHLGVMKNFVGDNNLIDFPRNSDACVKSLTMLEEAVLSESEGKRQRRFLFVRGSDYCLSGVAEEIIRRIINNAQNYNIAVFITDKMPDMNYSGRKADNGVFTTTVISKQGQFATSVNGFSDLRFAFNAAPEGITEASVKALVSVFAPPKFDNRYEKYIDLNNTVPYWQKTRKREKIHLPYGVVENTRQLADISLEKMNFATFLMGGSGSGKTTLIHALIAGIISNYHPDEVELWLADFKQDGFAPYATSHIPPHIKYILMDTSPEMICDFIDKMAEELESREARLGRLKIDDRLNVPVEHYMPALFVIIDEFSAVSEVLDQNESYKFKLDRLLSKGRSLGFKFLFASQAFTTGAKALSPFAKAQISSRLAMKNVDRGEIIETLSVPSSQKTESIKLMIETLPPYYVLYKEELPGGGCTVTRSKVLYFEGSDKDMFRSRYALFDKIRDCMIPVEEKSCNPSRPELYVNKHPVTINSETLLSFDSKTFLRDVGKHRSDPYFALSDEDVIVTFGQARRLNPDSYAFLLRSRRENIFVLGNKDETACETSLILSAARSFTLQNSSVRVWAHKSSPVYRVYGETHFAKFRTADSSEKIKSEIDEIFDNIQNRRYKNELIVLLGTERFLPELEDEIDAPQVAVSVVNDIKKNMAKTEKDIIAGNRSDDITSLIFQKQDEFEESPEGQSLSSDELEKKLLEIADYYQNMYAPENLTAKPSESETQQPKKPEKSAEKKDYSALLKTLIQDGSRFGYHFMIVLNDYSHLRDIGFRVDLFNHRLVFRTDNGDTSSFVINSRRGKTLAPHVCVYAAQGSANESYLISPFLHNGVSWS